MRQEIQEWILASGNFVGRDFGGRVQACWYQCWQHGIPAQGTRAVKFRLPVQSHDCFYTQNHHNTKQRMSRFIEPQSPVPQPHQRERWFQACRLLDGCFSDGSQVVCDHLQWLWYIETAIRPIQSVIKWGKVHDYIKSVLWTLGFGPDLWVFSINIQVLELLLILLGFPLFLLEFGFLCLWCWLNSFGVSCFLWLYMNHCWWVLEWSMGSVVREVVCLYSVTYAVCFIRLFSS